MKDVVRDRLSSIELLVLDVDGVLTDGGLTLVSTGAELKTFDVHDGYGIKKVQALGIKVAIITGRDSLVVMNRATELGIGLLTQGADDKGEALEDVLNRAGVGAENTLYVGDDEPDLPAMELAGIAVAVANAVDSVKEMADWTTKKQGGHGAVREVCDALVASRD